MLKEKLKGLISQEGDEKGSKKRIENIVVFIIILVITMIIINNVWNSDSDKEQTENATSTKKLATSSSVEAEASTDETDDLEENLANILHSIDGVGEVKVFVNYSESSTVEAMYNENTKTSSTEETDTSGGVRTIEETDTQKDVIYSEDDGNKTPVTQKVSNPKIEGAIITAKGAKDSEIKANIIDAVSAATGLASHKIQVFEMGGEN